MSIHHFKNSTNLACAQRTDAGNLRITFHTGAVYDYENVPAEVEQELYGAESSGSFFAREIKNVYVAKRVS